MKKSFMTRVLAVSLSAAMTFSLSAANMATASAATTVALSKTSVSMKAGGKKTLTLKNNTLNWKVAGASSSRTDVVTVTKKTKKVVLNAKNVKKTHKNVKVTVKLKTTKKKKNNTKKLVCKVTVKAPTSSDNPGQPSTPTAFTATANATSKTNVEVRFTQIVDQAALVPENFKIAEEGVEVTNVVGGNGQNVTLTISGAEAGKDYTLNITGLTVDGKAVDDQTVKFTTPPDATEGYTLKLTSNTDQVKADGFAEALITCEVKDPQGNTVTDKNYTIRFSTDRGSFAMADRVTVNGVATNMLRSVALDVAQDATITAEIIRVEPGDEELRGTQGRLTVNMTPVLNNIIVNPILDAESNQADRLTLHFQNKVDDDTYKKNGRIDTDRISIKVYDNIPQSTGILDSATNKYTTDKSEVSGKRVVNLKEVQGDDKALQVLVDKPLTDNSYIGVEVTMTDPTTKKTETYIERFMLTDSETPRLLKVEPQNRREVKVTFSEAVLPDKWAGDVPSMSTGNRPSAETLANYIIGGTSLENARWGEAGQQANVVVGSGLDGEDGREVVTIRLGKNKYFDPGEYTLTVRNIGDWAAASHGVANIVTTDSKDFTIVEDNTKPEIENVEVQSPEQYLVTFNKPVEVNPDYKEGTYKASQFDLVVNNTNETDGSVDDTLVSKTDRNTQSSVIKLLSDGTSIGAAKSMGGTNPIRVSSIDDRRYLVEVTNDWSQFYGSSISYYDDYFNHRLELQIPANALVNTDNGEKNTAALTWNLTEENATLRSADSIRPDISSIDWDSATQKATVKFTEPVKIRNVKTATGLNDEGLTRSVNQENETSEKNIQQATATFTCPGKQSITGTFEKFTDTTDTAVYVKPDEELTTGTWTLIVSGISDDFGNTTMGSGPIEINNAATNFKVAWASVAGGRNYSANRNSSWNASSTNWGSSNGDVYIFVKFTEAINKNASALYNNSSYTINSTNGSELWDMHVETGIKGYDDNSGITDSITIIIPARSAYVLGSGTNVMLALSSQIQSLSGKTLENNVEMRLPYNSDITSTSTNTLSNAVFGDHADEQFGKISSANYTKDIQDAIASGKYRKIILSANIPGDLTVSHPVDIDLNGFGIFGTLKASFSDGGTCNIINSGDQNGAHTGTYASTIETLDINTANADWHIGQDNWDEYASSAQAPYQKYNSDITCKKVVIRAVPKDTFVNNKTINELVVNSNSNTVKIENSSTGEIKQMILNSVNINGKVKLVNKNTSKKIAVTVKSGVSIEVSGASSNCFDIDVDTTQDVELKPENEVVEKLTGTTNKVTVIDPESGDKKSPGDLGIEATNDNIEGVTTVVSDKFVNTFKVTTSAAVGVDVAKLVKEIDNTIDPNGAKIAEEYTIYLKSGNQSPHAVTLNGATRTKIEDAGQVTVDAGASSIEVYILKGDDPSAKDYKTTVKMITITR